MIGLNKEYAVVPLTFPVDQTAAWASDIISLKNYQQAEVYIMTGGTFVLTAAVTMQQGNAVDSAATALSFTLYYETGMMLDYDGESTSTAAAAAETATGAAGGICTIIEDSGKTITGVWDNVTAFVDNEVLTFSGGKTAVVDGTRYNEDIMIPRTAVANTFNITQVLDVNKIYMIPVNSSMLSDGMDCIELNVADCDTVTVVAAFAILSQPRYAGTPMQTAIYN